MLIYRMLTPALWLPPNDVGRGNLPAADFQRVLEKPALLLLTRAVLCLADTFLWQLPAREHHIPPVGPDPSYQDQ